MDKRTEIMTNIWIYLVVLLVGLAGGIVIGVKLMGDQISITVRKIKNKKTSGDNSVVIPIDVQKALSRRKQRLIDKAKNKE